MSPVATPDAKTPEAIEAVTVTPDAPRKPSKGSRRVRRPAPKLTAQQWVARGASQMLIVLAVGFLLHMLVLSHVQHLVSQRELRTTFTAQLAAGTAPVSEGNYENVLLRDGEPVARLEIPAIGLNEIVVEGTSSGTLMAGPGHRRDTVLPGQRGASIIMGRANAYGGPFNRLEDLVPGDTISVVTGQGESVYEVINLRYAGDKIPRVEGGSRLVLETGRGFPYSPSGVVRVDARLLTDPMPRGARETTRRSLDHQDKALAGDSRTSWQLFLALELLVVAEVACLYSLRRMGPRKTWVVFVPILLFSGLLVAEQITKLLPNLL